MSYTSASHQGAIEMFSFTVGNLSCCPSLYKVTGINYGAGVKTGLVHRSIKRERRLR